MSQLRRRVENAIASVLPHGRVLVEDVARTLGMSECVGNPAEKPKSGRSPLRQRACRASTFLGFPLVGRDGRVPASTLKDAKAELQKALGAVEGHWKKVLGGTDQPLRGYPVAAVAAALVIRT